jgi:hypothetical protein
MSTRAKFGMQFPGGPFPVAPWEPSNAVMPAKLHGASICLSSEATNPARTKFRAHRCGRHGQFESSARFNERWERGRHENRTAGRTVCQFGCYAAKACGRPLIRFEQLAGVRKSRPEQIQIFPPKAHPSLLKRSQAFEQLLLPSRKLLQAILFLWIDRPKDHCEQGFDFLLVGRLSRLARTLHQFAFAFPGQRRRGLGFRLDFNGGRRRWRRRRRLGLGRLPDTGGFRSPPGFDYAPRHGRRDNRRYTFGFPGQRRRKLDFNGGRRRRSRRC